LPKKTDRGDSGLYSEETVSNNEFVYASSCHVENKHFKNSTNSEANSEEHNGEDSENLPLPVAELNNNQNVRIKKLKN
jgi:hypothetical protein